MTQELPDRTQRRNRINANVAREPAVLKCDQHFEIKRISFTRL